MVSDSSELYNEPFPFVLRRRAGTHTHIPFRAFGSLCEDFLVSMPIASYNCGFICSTRLEHRTIMRANIQ